MKLRKNKKGFTLIEIIVVLVIMGILLAIAVPAILGYVGQANDAKYLSQARGGYLGAQTIVASNAGTNSGGTIPAPDITKKSVNKELGLVDGDDGAVTNISCKAKAGNKSLEGCNIQVTGLSTKYVKYTADKKAEVINLDGAAFPTY